jgi:hypothetical protein
MAGKLGKKPVDDDDLDSFAVPVSEAVQRAVIRRGKRAPGFLQIPAQIMARLELKSVSWAAWCVLCALQWLEFRAEKKGEPLKLTNKPLEMFGGSRSTKLRGLDELLAREFIHPYAKSGNRSPLVRLNRKLQK